MSSPKEGLRLPSQGPRALRIWAWQALGVWTRGDVGDRTQNADRALTRGLLRYTVDVVIRETSRSPSEVLFVPDREPNAGGGLWLWTAA